jgi:hypothetical protein
MLALALAFAPNALADGDPASDILAPPSIRVYMTVAAPGPQLEQKLVATTELVTASGLPIKVAIIADKTDLGAVPQLWGKPQTYARFLGAELRLNFHDTLLVVMPQGFGVDGPYPHATALTALSRIHPRANPTPEGLTAAADQALRALALAGGLELRDDAGGGGGGHGSLPLMVAAVLALTALGGGVFMLRGGRLPGRAARPWRG